MRQVWQVLLDLGSGDVVLAHRAGELVVGFRPRATVHRNHLEPTIFVALVEAGDRPEAIAAADNHRLRYLTDGVLP